ncbi:MAG: ABC transporter substrate-binding protein, partial [Sphingomonadales bacterium]
YRTTALLASLRARGVRLVDVPSTDSVAGTEDAITAVAAAIGHRERGVAAIAAFRRDLTRIGQGPGRGRTAAYYQRQGYLTGTGTLVDDMMRRVGLMNLASRLGGSPLLRLSTEEMILARPNFLIMETGAPAKSDRGAAMLSHPALAAAVPARRRLYIPEALTTCGGSAYPRAVAMLAAQVRAADVGGGR